MLILPDRITLHTYFGTCSECSLIGAQCYIIWSHLYLISTILWLGLLDLELALCRFCHIWLLSFVQTMLHTLHLIISLWTLSYVLGLELHVLFAHLVEYLVAYFQRVLTSTFVHLVTLFVLGTYLCFCSAMVPLLLHNYLMHQYQYRKKCVGDITHLFVCMNYCLFHLFLLHYLSYGPPHTVMSMVPNLCFSYSLPLDCLLLRYHYDLGSCMCISYCCGPLPL